MPKAMAHALLLCILTLLASAATAQTKWRQVSELSPVWSDRARGPHCKIHHRLAVRAYYHCGMCILESLCRSGDFVGARQKVGYQVGAIAIHRYGRYVRTCAVLYYQPPFANGGTRLRRNPAGESSGSNLRLDFRGPQNAGQ
jgi:hypothetical protein